MTAAPQSVADSHPVTTIINSLSAERMLGDVRAIAKHVRLSGTPGEALAFDYIDAELAKLGLRVRRMSCDTLISLPGAASVTLLGEDERDLRCMTHSMAESTPADGVVGQVRYLGAGEATDFEAGDLGGRIALVDGLVSPGVAACASAAGCAAVVFGGDERLHQGIISSLYGSPTAKTVDQLPRCVAVSITAPDASEIKRRLSAGSVSLRVTAEVQTNWAELPLIVADLPAPTGDPTFAFFGVHVDSWDVGATDNAAGNAALLEIARAFSAHRSQLRRGVRLLFWSGHSHGRYAGSCWYVDNFWQELYEGAVVAMSIDSPGGKGADSLGGAKVMDEAVAVATEVAELAAGREVPAPSRPPGGEQPLWRVGVASMNPVRSRQSPGSATSMPLSPTSGYWHHTTDDTIDKVDPAVLLSDTKIYAAGLARFVTDEVLPLDYTVLARGVAAHIRELPPIVELGDIADLADRLADAVAEMMAAKPADINDRIRRLGRTLIPVLYTVGGQFEPDPTTRQGFLPGLECARRAAGLAATDPLFHALRTQVVREANRVRFALITALHLA